MTPLNTISVIWEDVIMSKTFFCPRKRTMQSFVCVFILLLFTHLRLVNKQKVIAFAQPFWKFCATATRRQNAILVNDRGRGKAA